MKKLLLLITLMTLSPTVLADGIDVKAAWGDALTLVSMKFILAAVVFFILSFGLWGKARNTAVEYGRWIGALLAAISIVSATTLHKTDIDLYVGGAILTVVWFAIGFVIGYVWFKFKNVKADTASSDEYLNAEQEFKGELKDIELWKKCYVEAGGNAAIAKKIYIKSRADKKVVVKQGVVTQDEDLSSYIQAMSEIRNNNKEEGLWIKCFAENDGDTARTEAAYIKYRVNKINSNAISNKNINDVQNEYADTPAFDLIEKKLYTIKEHNKKPYWLLKNNNAAIQANQIIYVYSNETDCKNAINSGELSVGVKLAIKA